MDKVWKTFSDLRIRLTVLACRLIIWILCPRCSHIIGVYRGNMNSRIGCQVDMNFRDAVEAVALSWINLSRILGELSDNGRKHSIDFIRIELDEIEKDNSK